MKDAEGALSMQCQCRRIHERKRNHVDRSDHSVRVRAFARQENSGTRTER